MVGLAGLGNRLPAPEPLARFGIVGIEKSVEAVIAGRDALDHFAL
jgi:hypothetical protein